MTTHANIIGSYTRLADPKKYGLKKGSYAGNDEYHYPWRKNAKKTDRYKEHQEIMATKPEFKQMVEIATGLPITRIGIEDFILYRGTVGIVEGVEGIIFCKIPKGRKEEQEGYAAGVREVKESEWLALMGK